MHKMSKPFFLEQTKSRHFTENLLGPGDDLSKKANSYFHGKKKNHYLKGKSKIADKKYLT